MAAAAAPAPDRLHALDAVRAGALILGVFFHAAMSFLPGQRAWIVMDVSRSAGLGVAWFTLHMFRMTTFFLVAGFFAHLVFHRRGLAGFARNRLTRIALPLVVGWPILFPLIAGAAIWGAAVMNGGVLPAKPPSAPPVRPPFAFPLTHLWFLYLLLIFYAGMLLLRAPVALVDRDGGVRRGVDAVVRAVMETPLAPLVLALPVFATMASTPVWSVWLAIPTPDNSLVPNAIAFVAYGVAFGFGWLLHRQTGLLPRLSKSWPIYLAVALAGTAGCLAITGLAPHFRPIEAGPHKLIAAACYATAEWSWCFAFIGAALAFCAEESSARRYVADASYWIYLVHLPIVMALQVAFAKLPLHWAMKYPLILAIAFAFMLATYQLVVRYSFVGAVLNGRKQRPVGRAESAAPSAAKP
jgi:peptidoglycan/LPS O-acetylase OafA/YrhL